MTEKIGSSDGNVFKNPVPPTGKTKPVPIRDWFVQPGNLKKLLSQMERRVYSPHATEEDKRDIAQQIAIETYVAGEKIQQCGKQVNNKCGLAGQIGHQRISRMLWGLHKRSYRNVSIEDPNWSTLASTRLDDNLHEKVVRSVLLEEIDEFLETLSLRDRVIFLARLLEDMEFNEIALRMGLSENTVKTVFYRTLKRVQRQFINTCCLQSPCDSDGGSCPK